MSIPDTWFIPLAENEVVDENGEWYFSALPVATG